MGASGAFFDPFEARNSGLAMNSDSVLKTSRVPLRVTDQPPAGAGLATRVLFAVRLRLSEWIRRLLELLGILPKWRRLAFTMQPQQQTQWCWSAVSTSVSLSYDPSSTWTQCTVVNAELGETTCCANGGSAACNKPWYLDLALHRVGNLASWASGARPFADVQTEINNGRPLGARIGWSGGGGHFVVLEGYFPGATQQLAVDDPWYGASDLSYASLSASYQGTGSWTHSYFTQA
jgi:Papain-like cysteine protease AvrRpt2